LWSLHKAVLPSVRTATINIADLIILNLPVLIFMLLKNTRRRRPRRGRAKRKSAKPAAPAWLTRNQLAPMLDEPSRSTPHVL